MKVEYISSKEQMLIAEDLYNITDSIEAAKRLEKDYGIKIKYGKSVKLRNFARKLDKTKFYNWDIEDAIERHAGYKIRLRDL